MCTWVRKFEVESHSSDKKYIVSLGDDGSFGCSCPAWIFSKGGRKDCKHIDEVRSNYNRGYYDKNVEIPVFKPEYVLANVRKPELKFVDGKIKLYVPLIRLPDVVNMEAVICNAMLTCGYTMQEVKEHRAALKYHPKGWTAGNILAWGEENEWWKIEYPADCKCVKKAKARKKA